MLVLQRSVNEEVIISMNGVEVFVTLVEVRGAHSARLGFKGPPEVSIHRREVYDAIQREKEGKA